MSDVSHKFTVSTAIATICDKESGRFALSGVHVAPAADSSEVSLVATDGRRLAATIEQGSATRPAIIRGDALKVSSRPIGAELNGALKVSTPGAKRGAPSQTVEYAAGEVDGRFPRYADIFPNSLAEFVTIELDYQYLSKLAAAIRPVNESDDNRAITIAIPAHEDAPAVFMAGHNLALIMPMAGNGGTKFDAQQEYRRRQYLMALVKHGFRPASILEPAAAPVESVENPAIELAAEMAQESAQESKPETAPPVELSSPPAPVESAPPSKEMTADELAATIAAMPPVAASPVAMGERGQWALNHSRGGVEIRFPNAPRAAIRQALRRGGFKWSARQGLWYAKSSLSTRNLARQLADGDENAPKLSAPTWVITPSAPVDVLSMAASSPPVKAPPVAKESPAPRSANVDAFLAMIGG